LFEENEDDEIIVCHSLQTVEAWIEVEIER
jgi:hypothetical protein